MAQRLLALFLLLNCLLPYGALAAEPGEATPLPAAKPQKTPEQRYLDGLACLQQADTPCAQVALAGINPASPYAKILEAQLAAGSQDYDEALRLLLPLQAENHLLPQASASLHATLAQAYEKQDNPLRTLQQYVLAATFMAEPAAIEANQQQLWEMLGKQPRKTLLEMRGESPDTVTQGWIDLALVAANKDQSVGNLEQWRDAYPGHPASAALLQQIAASAPAEAPAAKLEGKIALLLPLQNPAYAAAAEALRTGFMAAREVAQSEAEVQAYPTTGNQELLAPAYRLAVQEGAQHIAGPLLREEVNALAASDLVTATTVAFNQGDSGLLPPEKLLLFGRPVEAEARQVVGICRRLGMQSATVIAADTPLAKRMAEAFVAEWKAQQGAVNIEITFSAATNLAELKTRASARPADMIFLATDVEQARRVRPYLDAATPTFGTSHLYDGDAGNPLNIALAAIHFVDIPWLIDPASPAFTPYRQAALKIPKGEMQRWFALGVDAWHVLAGGAVPLHGLSGDIHWEHGHALRELSMAQFRGDRVVAEPLP